MGWGSPGRAADIDVMTPRVLRRCITIDDLRNAAQRRLPKLVFDFIDGGARDEQTSQPTDRRLRLGALCRVSASMSANGGWKRP